MASVASPLPLARVLDVDPDLGGNIDPVEHEAARRACRGELRQVPRGPWPSEWEAGDRDDLVAFVIVDGLVGRELSLGDRCMLELLGHTDVLHPPVLTQPGRLGTGTRLTAVSDVLLLVLGQSFVGSAARWPALLSTLHRRLESQRESLAIQGVIAHLPKAEHRLLLMLSHLTDRWGYVTPKGSVLPWALNHEILGRLIAARRPTVTLALRRLEADSSVQRREDGSWLLTATAERMINAIGRPPTVTHSLAERLMLYRQVSQTTSQARALHAEASQLLLHRRTGTATNTPANAKPPTGNRRRRAPRE